MGQELELKMHQVLDQVGSIICKSYSQNNIQKKIGMMGAVSEDFRFGFYRVFFPIVYLRHSQEGIFFRHL